MENETAASHPETRETKRTLRNQAIQRLREEGYSNNQIAQTLGISYGLVIQIVHELILEGKIMRQRRGRPRLFDLEREDFAEEIVKLWDEKNTSQEIAQKLDLSHQAVRSVIRQLIQAGKIARHARGRRSLLGNKLAKHGEQITKLREQGYAETDIAEKLTLSVYVVRELTKRLIAAGRIKDMRKNATWRDLGNKRAQTIIEMVKRRATLKEIGAASGGVTKQRAQQLVSGIRQVHGSEVLAPDKKLWTSIEAARELKTSVTTIERICAAGEIPCQRRSRCKKGAWLIDEKGMAALRKHPRVTREQICVICGTVFFKGTRSAAITCSTKCSQVNQQQLKKGYMDQEPSLESLLGWRKDLWQRLQFHQIPQNEKWLTINEAAKYTGLSNMQLAWLRYRNVVTIRPDPVKRWRGQPVATYAASEMDIARQVLAAHKTHNGKHD